MMSKSSIRSPRQHGFTLIELLVVVAIIALLISILLPSLRRAKAQARQVVCLTNLKEQANAAQFYAQDNKDGIIRGVAKLQDPNDPVGTTYQMYQCYSSSLVKYLRTYDGDKVYLYTNSNAPNLKPGYMSANELNSIIEKTKQFQCPDHPAPADEGNFKKLCKLDYVSNAMPLKYTKINIDYDAGSLQAGQFPEFKGIPGGDVNYVGADKLSNFPAQLQQSRVIWAAEAHLSLALVKPTTGYQSGDKPATPHFHHFFLTSMLPFGGRPRIANDLRHPGGVTQMWFDGHASVLRPEKIDVGWPKPIGQRLTYFASVPPEHW